MAKRALQEINAGSMADIAFLLLIFYLVTTTMDTNEGMTRKLPKLPDSKQAETEDVKERNVFVILINKNNRLFVENQLTDVKDLCEKTKEFFDNPARKENLSERREKDIPLLGGKVEVSSGVVSLRNDRGTSYNKYISVQNELVRAINELRESLSKRKFGKSFEDLDPDRQKAVQKFYPMAVSEAEPVEIK